MKDKIDVMIAIGAAIGANCAPCLKYLLPLAKENGATDNEIKDAINTALKVKKNSAHFTNRLMEQLTGEKFDPNEQICCQNEIKDKAPATKCC